MLTPAEEMGLSGMSLASRVRQAFYKIPGPQLARMMKRIREESFRRHLIYLRDGDWDTVRVLPCPLTVLPEQLAYIHAVSLAVHNATKRLAELYLQDPKVREILRLTDEEEKWLHDCWGPSLRDNNPVFGRLDAMVDFTSPMWKDSLRYVEPNMSCIGGLHLVPTADRIVHEVVMPILTAHDNQLHLDLCQDIREMLMQEVLDHLEAIGGPIQNLCFIEPKYAGSGPDEQIALAEYFRHKHGLRIMHADPSELTLKDDVVHYEGEPVGMAYRDYLVLDLIEKEKAGIDVAPMRALFKQNRMISAITAELDQKACWEVFTDPVLARKYFSAEERQIFRRHILWTRILADRSTMLPHGDTGDLLPYVRREHESLVLKPNRAFGGQGVVIGPSVTALEWESAIELALADKERWVVQQVATIPVSEFPVLGPDGAIHVEPFYTVMGFAPSRYGLAVLARASQKQVVNVALRGGVCAVMNGHPPRRLIGPDLQPEMLLGDGV